MKRVILVLMTILTLVSTGCKKRDPLGKKGDKLVKESVVVVDGEEVTYRTGNLLSVIEGKNVESLVWKTGSIGASDIDALKKNCQTSLRHLDMERVNFATGFGTYDIESYGTTASIKGPFIVPAEMCRNFALLESVILPAVATTVDIFAFSGCTSLKEVKFGNKLTTIERYSFIGCAMEHIEFPESLKTLGEEVFYNVPLKEITIPAGVTSFYDDTFIYYRLVSKLEKVTCNGTMPPVIGHSTTLNQCGNVFNLTPDGFKIFVPKKAVDKYKSASFWSAHADQIFAAE